MMAKAKQSKENQSKKKNRQRSDLATAVKPLVKMSGVVEMPLIANAFNGDHTIQRQNTLLGGLHTVQQHDFATNLGKLQGNRHLQTLVKRARPEPLQRKITPTDAIGQVYEGFTDIPLVSGWISQGETSEIKLTNRLFYNRHPDKIGEPIKRTDRVSIDEWRTIRDSIVRPMLKKALARHQGSDIRAVAQTGTGSKESISKSMLDQAENEVKVKGWNCTSFTLRRYIRAYLDVHFLGGKGKLFQYDQIKGDRKNAARLKNELLNQLKNVLGTKLAEVWIEGGPRLLKGKKAGKESRRKLTNQVINTLTLIRIPLSESEKTDKKKRKKLRAEAKEFALRWHIASKKMPEVGPLYKSVYALCLRFVYHERYRNKREEAEVQNELTHKGLDNDLLQIALANASEIHAQIEKHREDPKESPPDEPKQLSKSEKALFNKKTKKMKGHQTFGLSSLGAVGVLAEMGLGKIIETSTGKGSKDILERYNLNNPAGDLWVKLKPGMILQAWRVGEIKGAGHSIKFAKGGHSTMFMDYIKSTDGNTIGLRYQDQTGSHKRFKNKKTNMVKKGRKYGTYWSVWFAAEAGEGKF